MSFDWDDPDERRRFFLTLRVKCDDLHDINDDMLARPRDRQFGPAMHQDKCRELWDSIFAMLDWALGASGGAAPGGEPEGGSPTAH